MILTRGLARAGTVFFALALLAACGGGGGGSGSGVAGAAASFSVSQTSLSVTASTTQLNASTANLAITVTNSPAAGVWLAYKNSSNAIASVSIDGYGSVTVTFKDPAALAVGTYTDTLQLAGCLDQQCAHMIANSPQTVNVSYTVAQGNPATATPKINSVSPAAVLVGGPAVTLTVSGRNFATDSVVIWNASGTPLSLATTYVSPTQLTASLDALAIASVAVNANLFVSNQSGGGNLSAPVTVAEVVAAPVLSGLSPATAYVGGSPFILTATGSGFSAGSQITWNGTVLPTTFVSATQLTTIVPTSLLSTAGTAQVAVSDASILGPVSTSLALPVTSGTLAVTRLSPATLTAGDVGFTLTVFGSGFDATSVVQWQGAARTTTRVSSTEILAQISAADIATIGSAAITVTNGGGGSSAAGPSVAIVAPTPDAGSYQINARHSGSVQFATVLAPASWPKQPNWVATFSGYPSYAVIGGGRAFITTYTGSGGSSLYALSLASGQTLWGPGSFTNIANAAYDAGTVFVVNETGTSYGNAQVQAYDAATGNLKWSTVLLALEIYGAPPVVANGLVYVGAVGSGGAVAALDETSGALVWTQTGTSHAGSQVTVSADGVALADSCGVTDLRASTGETVWNGTAGCIGGFGQTAVIANGTVYAPGMTAGVEWNAQSGVQSGSYAAAVPAIGSQNGFYLGSNGLSAFNLSTGTVAWNFAGDNYLALLPLAVNNYVFVESSQGNLYALDQASGANVWTAKLGANLWNSIYGVSLYPFVNGLSAGDGYVLAPAGYTVSAFQISTSP